MNAKLVRNPIYATKYHKLQTLNWSNSCKLVSVKGRWNFIQILYKGISYLGICLDYIFPPLLHLQDKEALEVQS